MIAGNAPPAQATTAFQIQGVQTLVSQYRDIRDGRLLLYYFGILRYNDAFGNQRQTEFCVYLGDVNTRAPGFCQGFNDLT